MTKESSSYDALFALATGDDPRWDPVRTTDAAVSYVVRVFADAFVAEVPDDSDDVEVLVRAGSRLAEQGTNDPQSFRLAVVNAHGPSREEALRRAKEVASGLRFVLT